MNTSRNKDSQESTFESSSYIRKSYQSVFIVAIYKLMFALIVIILGDLDSQRIMQVVVGLILLGLGLAIKANIKLALVVAISILPIEAILHLSYLMRNAVSESPTISFCLLYTSPSPRDRTRSRMPSSA